VALQGTIKDFGLADIFQLIGIQRKTGTLTLESDTETVGVKFLEGQVVGAENQALKLEDLLGAVLVRTGRIGQSQLEAALRIQRKTLQRLGYLLVQEGYISEEDLREALNVQVTQIVYRLFRWRDGRYRFDPTDHMEYDQNFTPINAETILMEGARMVDEWPIIERKVRSEKLVYRRTEASEGLVEIESIMDADVDLDSVFSSEESPREESDSEEIRLSRDEQTVLRMVDGRATVKDLVDRAAIGEFDTYRILYELLNRNLIEEVRTAALSTGTSSVDRGSRIAGALLIGAIFAGAIAGTITLPFNPISPWKILERSGSTEQLRTYASRGRIERIERAVHLFFLDTGSLPGDLGLLVSNGYLEARDTRDPWGRQYVYILDPGSYTLTGLDAEGQLVEDLTVSRRFTTLQRMILDGSTPGEI
jgi:hypothetical protein